MSKLWAARYLHQVVLLVVDRHSHKVIVQATSRALSVPSSSPSGPPSFAPSDSPSFEHPYVPIDSTFSLAAIKRTVVIRTNYKVILQACRSNRSDPLYSWVYKIMYFASPARPVWSKAGEGSSSCLVRQASEQTKSPKMMCTSTALEPAPIRT